MAVRAIWLSAALKELQQSLLAILLLAAVLALFALSVYWGGLPAAALVVGSIGTAAIIKLIVCVFSCWTRRAADRIQPRSGDVA